MRLVVGDDGTASGHFVGSSAFMRLRGQRKSLPPRSAHATDADFAQSVTTLSPDDVGDWIHMFAIGVQVPDLFCRVDWGADGSYRLCLYDTAVTSWAAVDHGKGRTEYGVTQSGPRKLWDELETAWRWWDERQRPGFERFGLTVTADGHTLWLDRMENPVPVRSG